jgi:hypothetical protein
MKRVILNVLGTAANFLVPRSVILCDAVRYLDGCTRPGLQNRVYPEPAVGLAYQRKTLHPWSRVEMSS